ncbi:MAG: SDR family oxidoreductase [Gammaproteobacteria bacterium]
MTQQLLVTGAAGGMGRAISRLLGASHELVLTDTSVPALEAFAAGLREEGYRIAGVHGGDLREAAVIDAIAGTLAPGGPALLAHTAGVSAAQADWRTVMDVNLVATERLLRMFEARLASGSVAVLIASAAGHAVAPKPDVEALLDAPLEPEFLDAIGKRIAEIVARGGPLNAQRLAYHFSKNAVMRTCRRRAKAWGDRGARIVSISPGSTRTPMFEAEIQSNPTVEVLARESPIGRSCTPMDIAFAVRFLASPEAAFITGTDLLVDGGLMAQLKTAPKAR